MARRCLKNPFFFLIFLISFGCGIKKDPVPLPKPDFEIKRIGEKVYLIPGKDVVKAEGFLRKGRYFFRIDSKAFCFKVYHRLGRSVRACVDEALRDSPEITQEITEEGLKLNLSGFVRYRIYSVASGGELIPERSKEVRKQSVFLPRRFKDYEIAVTGVLGSVESDPVYIRIPSREPPTPIPPEDVRIIKKEGKVVLYWSHPEDEVLFEVYRNGALLTPSPIRVMVFSEDDPGKPTVYEIVAVNRFGKKSLPARVFYRP